MMLKRHSTVFNEIELISVQLFAFVKVLEVLQKLTKAVYMQ